MKQGLRTVFVLLTMAALLPIQATADTFQPVTFSFAAMMADPADGYLFGLNQGQLDVVNYQGQLVTNIPLQNYGTGLGMSGTKLYVSESGVGQIEVVDIGTLNSVGSLGVGSFAQPSGAVLAGGRLYFSTGCPDTSNDHQIKSIDPSNAADIRASGIYFQRCPTLLGSPTDPNILFAWEPDTMLELDVSTDPPTQIASKTLQQPDGIGFAYVAPAGNRIFISNNDEDRVEEWRTSDLGVAATYPMAGNFAITTSSDGNAVAISGDTGTRVYPRGDPTPSASWESYAEFLFFTPDGTKLVGPTYGTFLTFDHARQALQTSNLAMTASPRHPAPGDTVDVTGTLSLGDAADPGGQTIDLYRIVDGTNTFESLGSQVTQPDGSFHITQVAPDATGTAYIAFWSGDATHSGAEGVDSISPVKLQPTMTIAAAPASITSGDLVTISGTLAFPDAGDASGHQVTIYQSDDAHPSPTMLGTAVTGPGGAYSFAAHPVGSGELAFFALFDGTTRYLPVQAWGVSVQSHRLDPGLALSFSPRPLTWGKTGTVTVSLGPAQEGEPVNLYATPYGGAKTLVASGNVDALGNFSRKVSPTVSTLYTAEYAGDGRFLPATIDQNYVVDVLMTGNMIKYQGKSGNYALYDANKTVLYEFTIKPDHTRSDIDMHVETHANGNWRELSLSTVKMPAGGKAIVGFPAAYLRPGKQYRIWGGFEYDGDHGPTHSPFGYFKLK